MKMQQRWGGGVTTLGGIGGRPLLLAGFWLGTSPLVVVVWWVEVGGSKAEAKRESKMSRFL